MLLRGIFFLNAFVVSSLLAYAQVPRLAPPWTAAAADPAVPGLRFVPDHGAIDRMAAEDRLTLAAVALPTGGVVDLELTRVDLERHEFRFYVDDVERPELLDGLGLSVWTGAIVGMPGSNAALGVSHAGIRGWIHTGLELHHVLARPGANDDWTAGDLVIVEESVLLRSGAYFDFTCGTSAPVAPPLSARLAPQGSGTQLLGGGCSLREAKVAITTDFQLYQRFNNLAAETAYVTTLFSWIAAQYEAQISTRMTFPYVAFYTTSNDPWTATTAGAALNELSAAWGAALPNGARVGQLVSGASLGGGVGYLSALCGIALSVAGNLVGNTPFPVTQGPSNWDFVVCSHEIGHNFGAVHTHEFCPPVDQCPPSQYWGGCQTAQVCTNQGTIMSYCHLCSGGTSNILPSFHAQSVTQMINEAGCLPYYERITGDHPASFPADVPITLDATVDGGTGTGLVRLFYRYYGGPFTQVVMTSSGPSTYTATLPPVSCDATPEFYYSVVGDCAPSTDPPGAPTTPFTAVVGASGAVLDDDFQTDQGWTASVSGATAGGWQRGVPVNDPGTAFDPPSDFDGSGQCWLTGNALGNSDVDGGSVILTSPALNLVGTGQTISYAYWLRLSNTNGVDMLRVEVSSNGTSGPWITVATHTTDATVWRTHAVDAATMSGAGVTLGANMRVRFTVNDGGTASTVEGAIDAFAASRVLCSSTAGSFCRGDGGGAACPCDNVGTSGRGCANSVWSQGGGLAATGTPSVSGDTIVLGANAMTGATCVFFQGTAEMAPVAVDDGLGCVTGSVVRLGTKPVSTNSSSYPQSGDLSVSVRGAIPPAGATRYYQCFYRNAATFCTPATSNRTNGVVLVWQP